jgi:hypothetical protein
MTNPNDKAQPEIYTTFDFADAAREKAYGDTYSEGGLTKREYFAGLAMQGILSSNSDRGEFAVAKMAIRFTDALIDKLNENQ